MVTLQIEDIEKKSCISLKELQLYFENEKIKVVIPLLQRNYKWSAECAAELAEDLWDFYCKNKDCDNIPYLLKLLSIHVGQVENEIKQVQVIDGQQRIITLAILFSYFRKFSKDRKKVLDFSFERDDIFKFNTNSPLCIKAEHQVTGNSNITDTTYQNYSQCGKNESREYFLNNCLKCNKFFPCNKKSLYTDTKRMQKNYYAMILPLTVRDIIECYKNAEEKYDKKIKGNEKQYDNRDEIIKEDFSEKLKVKIESLMGIFVGGYKEACDFLNAESKIKLAEYKEKNSKREQYVVKHKVILDLLFEYGTKLSQESNIDLTISDEADKCMQVILYWKKQFIDSLTVDLSMTSKYENFIFERSQLFCNFTSTEPIEEFLNINENKTSFVISDYIKAHLIIDSEKIQDKNSGINIREDILQLFSELSSFLYDEDYRDIWELVKRGYGPEEEHKNENGYSWEKQENRLKILLCDKYSGVSIRGFEADKEYRRLKYFCSVLDCLRESINEDMSVYSVYNAVWVLYSCTKERFFAMFGKKYHDKYEELRKVIRKKFNFQEFAYEKLTKSENPWYIQYYLESLLYDRQKRIENVCDMKKDELEKNRSIDTAKGSGLYVSTDWIRYVEPDEIMKYMVKSLYNMNLIDSEE